MTKCKYLFEITKVHVRGIKNKKKKDKYIASLLKDKEILDSINSIVGTKITIIENDSKDFLNEEYFFALNRAEHRASQIVSSNLGSSYGGSQAHMSNYRKDADIHGILATCKPISIEEIDNTPEK